MHVSQIIMLYTLNLYSAMYQLYLNKTGRKKTKKSCTRDAAWNPIKCKVAWVKWPYLEKIHIHIHLYTYIF